MAACPHCLSELDAVQSLSACPTCNRAIGHTGHTSIMPANVSVWSEVMPSVDVDGEVAEPSNLVVKRHIVAGAGESEPNEADFELLDVLGEGGMGIIYQARQTSVDRTIALKMIRPDKADRADIKARLLAEAAVTGDLNHPNIVPIYDVGETENGAFFYAMKEVQGVPWSRDLRSKDLQQNLDILLRVADAVAFAHSRGVIHRDLKPHNVMLGDYGEVLVMDWGMAMTVADGGKATPVTRRSSVGGTPAYMAPEMAMADRDNIGVATDIYLLGAVLYEIIADRPPHLAATVQEMLDSAAKNAITPLEPRTELADIAMRAMAFSPADRYESVKDLQNALRAYRSHSESIALSSQARNDLSQAALSGGYDDYAQALFGFTEALALWDGNTAARNGEIETRKKYAETALSKDDLDLAASLLLPEITIHDEIAQLVEVARNHRLSQRKRQRFMVNAARALLVIVFLVLTFAFLSIRGEKEKVEFARETAESARQVAESAQEDAETARMREMEQRRQVEEEKTRVVSALALAEEQRAEAVDARHNLEGALQSAEEARQRADTERESAITAKRRADRKSEEAELARTQAVAAQQQAAIDRNEAEIQRQFANAAKIKAEADTKRMESLVARMQQQEQETELARKEAKDGRIRARQAELHQDKLDYVLRIYAVKSKIKAFDLAGARADLEKFTARHRNFEWGRLHYLCSPAAMVLKGHQAQVNSIAFDAGGRRLVSGGSDRQIIEWDVNTGNKLNVNSTSSELRFVGFVGDDGHLIAAASNSTVTLQGATGHRAIRDAMSGRIAMCTDVSIQNDFGATGYGDGHLELWRSSTGKDLQRVEAHTGGISAIAFSDGERLLATGARDNTVRLWRVEETAAAIDVNFQDPMKPSGWKPDHDRDPSLMIVTPHIEVTDIERVTGKTSRPTVEPAGVLPHEGTVSAVAFSPDGMQLLSASGKTAKIWDLGHEDVAVTYTHRNDISALAFFPDGKRICTATTDGTIHIWRADSAREVLVMRGHRGAVQDITVSPDGQLVASAGADRSVRVWDILEYRRIMVLSNHTDAVLSSTIADNRLITGSRDGSIAISDLESGHHLHALKGHQEPVYELAMTKDGKGIISRSTDGKFNLWDLNGMNLRTGQHQLKRTLSIGSLAIPVYSPDRSLYVQTTEPHIGALLLAATKKPYVYFKGHAARITCAAFSPDGSRVVTGSSDETAKLWDIQTGLELLSLGPHGAAVTHAQFSADGQAVVTGTSDGRVFVWKSDAWK